MLAGCRSSIEALHRAAIIDFGFPVYIMIRKGDFEWGTILYYTYKKEP